MTQTGLEISSSPLTPKRSSKNKACKVPFKFFLSVGTIHLFFSALRPSKLLVSEGYTAAGGQIWVTPVSRYLECPLPASSCPVDSLRFVGLAFDCKLLKVAG